MDQSLNQTQNKKRNLQIAVVVGLAIAAAASRLMPHPWNFSPIAAMTVFCGAMLMRNHLALLVPLAAIFVSDLLLGAVHSRGVFFPDMPVVYACYVLNIVVGKWLTTRRRNAIDVGTALLFCSVMFFIATNVSYWWFYHPHTALNLAATFEAAIPFFRNALLGNAVFAGVFFGGWAIAETYVPALRTETIDVHV